MEQEPALPKDSEELKLTRLCFKTLNLHSHDLGVSHDSLRAFILDGHYLFTEYALVHAFDHVQDICKRKTPLSSGDYDSLRADLHAFIRKRYNARPRKAPADKRINDTLAMFKKENFFADLVQAAVYAKWSRSNDEKDNREEPVLILRTQILEVRALMERMVAVSDLENGLKLVYGTNLFKCSEPRCASFHEGFAAQETRDRHCKIHDRVFLCSSTGCQASMIGFGLIEDLKKHEIEYHKSLQDEDDFPWNGNLESMNIVEEIRRGNFSAFEFWISQWKGPIPLSEWKTSPDPLTAACRFGQDKMLELMLDKIDVKWSSTTVSKFALYDAIKAALDNKNEQAAITMLQRIDYPRKRILKFLSCSLRHGLDHVSMALLKHPSIAMLFNSPKARREATYWKQTVRYGRWAVFKFLLEKCGIDIAIQDQNGGHIYLHATAEYGQIEMATYLIKTYNCDKWVRDRSHNAALSLAGRSGHTRFISVVYPEETPEIQKWLQTAQFRDAARDGDYNLVKELLEKGCFTDEIDNEGFTPWMWAVHKGHVDVVECLLHRTDIDFRRKSNYDGVLHFTAAAGHTSIMRLLLESGKFDTEIEKKCGYNHSGALDKVFRGAPDRTPLGIAQLRGYHEIAKIIEDYQNMLEPKSDSLRTPKRELELFTEAERRSGTTDPDQLPLAQEVSNERLTDSRSYVDTDTSPLIDSERIAFPRFPIIDFE